MARHRRHSRHSKRFWHVKKILLTPFYIIADICIGLKDALDQTLLFFGLKKEIRGSYNRDFEKAGRESSPRMLRVDSAAASNLNKAHLERTTESIEAEAWEKRLLARNSAAAKELREEMTSDARSVSSGSVVSHLAKMNRKAEAKSSTDASTPEAAPDEPSKELPE